MEILYTIFQTNGWAVAFIVVFGLIVLGFLKYSGAFKKKSEASRHRAYIAISVGLSLIGSLIYMVACDCFEPLAFGALVVSVWSLNQAVYNLYAATPLKGLFKALIQKILIFCGVDASMLEEEKISDGAIIINTTDVDEEAIKFVSDIPIEEMMQKDQIIFRVEKE